MKSRMDMWPVRRGIKPDSVFIALGTVICMYLLLPATLTLALSYSPAALAIEGNCDRFKKEGSFSYVGRGHCVNPNTGPWQYGPGTINCSETLDISENIQCMEEALKAFHGYCEFIPSPFPALSSLEPEVSIDNMTYRLAVRAFGYKYIHHLQYKPIIKYRTNKDCERNENIGGRPDYYYHAISVYFKRDVTCPSGYSEGFVGLDAPASYRGVQTRCNRPIDSIDPTKTSVGGCDTKVQENKTACGNPINVITGNKYQVEQDVTGPNGLGFKRYYNSLVDIVTSTTLGKGWRHHYDRRIALSEGIDLINARAYRPDGKVYTYDYNGTDYVTSADISQKLTRLADNSWVYTSDSDNKENYDVDGYLTSMVSRDGKTQTITRSTLPSGDNVVSQVTDNFGRTLGFIYDANSRLSQLTAPDGQTYAYTYDTNDNLISVTYADNTTRSYHYENASYPHALTGITDANGNRFASYAYDATGKAVLTEHAGGANQVTVSYTDDTTSVVTNALGDSQTYTTIVEHGSKKLSSKTGQACTSCGTSAQQSSYDENGYPQSMTDLAGITTNYDYDAEGLQVSKTEAAGTPESRTITTEWHPVLRLPTRITEPGRETVMTYDANGNVLSRQINEIP